MKIQLLSDLHLEVHPHFVPTPAPGADVLLRDTWQRPMVVLDEVSTAGRMLLTASGPLADVSYAGESDTAPVRLYRNFIHLLSTSIVSAHG